MRDRAGPGAGRRRGCVLGAALAAHAVPRAGRFAAGGAHPGAAQRRRAARAGARVGPGPRRRPGGRRPAPRGRPDARDHPGGVPGGRAVLGVRPGRRRSRSRPAAGRPGGPAVVPAGRLPAAGGGAVHRARATSSCDGWRRGSRRRSGSPPDVRVSPRERAHQGGRAGCGGTHGIDGRARRRRTLPTWSSSRRSTRTRTCRRSSTPALRSRSTSPSRRPPRATCTRSSTPGCTWSSAPPAGTTTRWRACATTWPTAPASACWSPRTSRSAPCWPWRSRRGPHAGSSPSR